MTLLLLAMVLGALAAGWAVGPVVTRRLALLGDPIPSGVLDANARKRVALASLQEIEYDRISGKLDEQDYRALRNQLEREALLAIEAADEVQDGGRAEPEVESFQVTHSCGFANPPGSRFCSGCGRKLG